jgi:hypothetical protein
VDGDTSADGADDGQPDGGYRHGTNEHVIDDIDDDCGGSDVRHHGAAKLCDDVVPGDRNNYCPNGYRHASRGHGNRRADGYVDEHGGIDDELDWLDHDVDGRKYDELDWQHDRKYDELDRKHDRKHDELHRYVRQHE